MWIATIHSKDFNNGTFRAFVKYSDGTNGFDDVITLSNQENLDATIRNRIKQLETTATFADSVPTGEFTPAPEPVKQQTQYELAIQEVNRVKNLVELGILKETDQEFVDAVTALKAEYAKK